MLDSFALCCSIIGWPSSWIIVHVRCKRCMNRASCLPWSFWMFFQAAPRPSSMLDGRELSGRESQSCPPNKGEGCGNPQYRSPESSRHAYTPLRWTFPSCFLWLHPSRVDFAVACPLYQRMERALFIRTASFSSVTCEGIVHLLSEGSAGSDRPKSGSTRPVVRGTCGDGANPSLTRSSCSSRGAGVRGRASPRRFCVRPSTSISHLHRGWLRSQVVFRLPTFSSATGICSFRPWSNSSS